uniref:HEAT repeat-containing protein 1 n=1 Tax=Cacopsylla melanoneura TaxID=428564 RepID=A0A8D8ZPL5_9HEMI
MSATTSLKEQLQKLRAPQTNLLQDVRKRPSFMFDADKAASITRATFYEIGKNGLNELIALDSEFQKFSNTLFNESTLYFQRTVETKEVNEDIDGQIKELFYHLSPYFSIRPAHCVLEWLIVRYNVHMFNTDDLLFFLLPYYHTKLFARALQVVDIKTHFNRWSWLYKVRKHCIPLASDTLYTRCATDGFLLKLICQKTEEAVQLLASSPTKLSTVVNFYTTCLVGVIQSASPLEDLHISHMLPSLILALDSGVKSFVCGAFVVFNFIMSKARLEPKAVKSILKKALKVKMNIHEEQTLLLLSIAQKYPHLKLPPVSLKTLAKKEWFIKCLLNISQDPVEYDVAPLCYLVVKHCIDYVNEHQKPQSMSEEEEELMKKIKLLGMHVLLNIKLDRDEAIAMIELIKESSIVHDSTDVTGLVRYCSRLVQTLESQYPSAWDSFIIKYSRREGDSSLSEVQKRVLRLNIEQSSHAEVFMKLTDSKALLRAETLKYLASHADPSSVRDSIRDVIASLWKDDSPIVIDALLELPEPLRCLDINQLIDVLVIINQQTVGNKVWEATTENTLEKLLNSDLCENLTSEQRSNVVLALLPYLYYNQSCLETILKSKFAQNDSLLKHMAVAPGKTQNSSVVWETLVTKPPPGSLPPTDHVIDALSHHASFKKPIYVTFGCLILAANMSSQENPAVLQKVFKFVSKLFESSHVQSKVVPELNHEQFQHCVRVCHKGKLPLVIYSHFMQMFIGKLQVPAHVDNPWLYCTTTALSSLLVDMFCTFVNKCNQAEKNGQAGSLNTYVNIIKHFIAHFMSDVKDQIKFYCNLSLNVNADINLSIWCLYMMHQLIQKHQVPMDAQFVPYFMVLLYSNNEVVRKLSLDVLQSFTNTFKGLLSGEKSGKGFNEFLKDLIKYREEIYLDNQCVVTYVGEVLSGNSYHHVLDSLLSCIVHEETPSHVTMQLLQILDNVYSCHIFKRLVPLTQRQLIKQGEDSTYRVLQEPQSRILYQILSRFSQNTSEILNEVSCWNCIQECVRDFSLKMELDGKSFLCANVILDNMKPEVYDELTPIGKERLLHLLLDIKHETENDDILICIKDFVKKISLDCKLIEVLLKNMTAGGTKQGLETPRRRRYVEVPTVDLLNTKEWKLGMVTLESIEHKKKLENAEVLLPHIFQILKKCLEFDEQMYVEYTKQLCLTSVHNCFLKIENVDALPPNLFDIDAVVESIRTSKNPQTHHQALLLLSYIASVLPDQVLKKFMPIFTFMGNSILRLDDAYSLQIINKVIENVVPVILTASNKKSKLSSDTEEAHVVEVLRVFTDAIMDIPDHRRIYLMEKLLTTLNNGHYLYVFLQLMFERHVLHPEPIIEPITVKRYNKDLNTQQSGGSGIPKRLKLALHVCSKYPLNILIESCYKLVQFLQLIPQDKDDRFSSEEARRKVMRVIKVNKITPKQFRHYKYTLLMFTSSLLSSQNTVALISKNNEYEQGHTNKLDLDDMFKSTIEEILKYTQVVTKQADGNTEYGKYWAGMLSQCYDILDKINALIDSTVFVNVIKKLLKHQSLSLRKRCLDMLNWRLQQKHHFLQEDLLKLVKPLVTLAVNSEQVNSIDSQLNQQTALISLKLFVRIMGEDQNEVFIDILDQLMGVFERDHEPPVTASLILCIAEVCSVLKAHALSVLPTFMPKLISCLRIHHSCDVITLGVVSSLLKIVEHMSMFLSPYLVDILAEVCELHSTPWGDSGKAVAIRTKLGYLKSKLAHDIPGRVLTNSIASCYTRLIETNKYETTATLLHILGDSFSSTSFLYNTDTTEFFLHALDYRVTHSSVEEDNIQTVETSVVQAFVKLILKLSESNFKPLFNKLYDWAFRSGLNEVQDRVITFFILTSQIAEALKSLFVLFAGTIVKDCSAILDKTQLGKHSSLYLPEEENNAILLDAVLKTLLSIFTHDVHQFMTKERFNLLMQHLVDQLENKLVHYETRCRSLVQPCIVQFAASSNDDLQWKNLNYEILLKTRDNDSYVRLVSLECVLQLATKLGDNFLPLLPETVPFLAELLEDENEAVEKACHRVVQEMEQLLGEPISKYF